MRLKDRIAPVTGTSRGIGRAVAERFVREGVKSRPTLTPSPSAASPPAPPQRSRADEANGSGPSFSDSPFQARSMT